MDEEIARVNRRAERLGRTLTAGTKLLLFLLFAGSILSAMLGITSPIWIAITAVPSFFQTVDWLWPSAPIGKYRVAFERLRLLVVRLERRRRLAALFARHGREELAARHLAPEEAGKFSVAAQTRRRRLRRRLAGATGAVLVACGASYVVLLPTADAKAARYSIGQEFPIGGAFKLTVLRAPNCYAHRGTNQPACSVDVRIRNTSHFSQIIGPGSFGSVNLNPYPNGSFSSTELLSHGNNFDYVDAAFDTTDPGPEQTISATLYYNVPTTDPDELLFIVGPSQHEVYVSLHP